MSLNSVVQKTLTHHFKSSKNQCSSFCNKSWALKKCNKVYIYLKNGCSHIFFHLQITYQHLEPISVKQKLMILVQLLLENALVNLAHPQALKKTVLWRSQWSASILRGSHSRWRSRRLESPTKTGHFCSDVNHNHSVAERSNKGCTAPVVHRGEMKTSINK